MAWERSESYKPGQTAAHKLSRSKIDLFMQCPRCFWLGERLKIKRPSGPPFQINKAIDELFKKEFDKHRLAGTKHPLQTKFKIDAKPFAHKDMDKWRANFTGVQAVHEATNLVITGAVDDVWVNKDEELLVVDYKATAKSEPVKELGPEGTWHDGYRRQMEIYQWLLRSNGFKVSDTGYFVYTTTDIAREGFGDTLLFNTYVFPYIGKSDWVDGVLIKIKACMESDVMPEVGKQVMKPDEPCEYCLYSKSRTELTLEFMKKANKK